MKTASARERAQILQAEYITSIKRFVASTRISAVSKILDHVLAQFGYFSAGYEVLKQLEG